MSGRKTGFPKKVQSSPGKGLCIFYWTGEPKAAEWKGIFFGNLFIFPLPENKISISGGTFFPGLAP